jgi:3-oxoacyl-[acyl-carrier protein] reductase
MNVLITGAGRGIGKRLALGFARKGASVVLIARTSSEVNCVKREIEKAGGSSMDWPADVGSFEQMKSAVCRTNEIFGRVDVLIHAAGIQGPIGPFVETDPDAWEQTVRTHLFGAANACRAVLPSMIEAGSGKIILLSGGGAAKGRPYFTAYAAAKTAVVRLVESLALELADSNIQVNAMAPGASYTHMTDTVLEAGEQLAGAREFEGAKQIQCAGGVSPQRQVDLAWFLASQDSNFINGKLIHVNDDWESFTAAEMDSDALTLRRAPVVRLRP